MQNWIDTVASQYANSPRLLSMIGAFNSAVDPAQAITNFYDFVWDVESAQGFGLDVWGNIVGVSRLLNIASGTEFGFEEAAGDSFGQSAFYFGETPTSNYSVSDDIFRRMIYAKALSNITGATISAYNQMLQLLFPGRGNAFCTDTGNMVIVFSFSFSLLPTELAILQQSGIFSAPTGVLLQIGYIPDTYNFGFAEALPGSNSFDAGVFYKGFY